MYSGEQNCYAKRKAGVRMVCIQVSRVVMQRGSQCTHGMYSGEQNCDAERKAGVRIVCIQVSRIVMQ